MKQRKIKIELVLKKFNQEKNCEKLHVLYISTKLFVGVNCVDKC